LPVFRRRDLESEQEQFHGRSRDCTRCPLVSSASSACRSHCRSAPVHMSCMLLDPPCPADPCSRPIQCSSGDTANRCRWRWRTWTSDTAPRSTVRPERVCKCRTDLLPKKNTAEHPHVSCYQTIRRETTLRVIKLRTCQLLD